ncbi:signal peptidase II [Cupriavidus sp. Agwp_2]|uniref:signal peptidase II n=1 Tax=Cupriavidus sp. Agwp_2 TaxID=2897324 RepID=UPI003460084C
MRANRSIGLGFILAALIVAMDIATKVAIVAWVEYGASLDWLPVLNVVHVLNRGAAFSFLHGAAGWQRLFFIGIALAASAFLIYMIRRAATSHTERISYGLILGGALANMIDRVARGAVVDWIDLHWGSYHWPAFNVADIGITLGAALMVFHEFFGRKQAGPARG